MTHARLDAADLAGAAGWVASALATRPAVPVLGGMLLRVAGGRLSVVLTCASSLAVNPRYLLDGLKAVTAETVTLSIADAHRPVVLGSPATPYTYTVMPVRSRGWSHCNGTATARRTMGR